MKCTNLILSAMALFTISSSAFAEGNQWDLYASMSDAGFQTEVAMGRAYVSLENLSCQHEVVSGEMICTANDTSIEAEGAQVTFKGPQAEAVLNALKVEWPYDPSRTLMFEAKSITCVTSNEALIDIEVGEIASCEIEY